MKVTNGNSKLSASIPSINLPAGITCRADAPCAKGCYAKKGNFAYKNIQQCYVQNLKDYIENPMQYFNDIIEFFNQELAIFRYARWHARCYNKNYGSYRNYGNRGIKICNEWKDNFLCFYNWAISNGYNDNLSIDRINNNGDYEPSNCHWADKFTQANNTRHNKYYFYNGKMLTIAEISRLTNINQYTLYTRIKQGWSDERAFNTPTRRNYE